MSNCVLSQVSDGIATVTINRPKQLNALNLEVLEALDQTMAALDQDQQIRVVILTGAGEKSFVAGADIGSLQLGIGAIPEAVGQALRGKHDLGIHTELLTDSMIDLIQCGAVTNRKKPIHTGRTVATLSYGSQKMYDYIHDNPTVQLMPVSYVNDPAVIARHPNFISVNSAVEVDFYGQVCAESIGSSHISGTGGQADFVRGATRSKGGKSFIALPSTAGKGTVSRIRPVLTEGAVVTTSKNDVDYIVTEYGVAKLRGKTLSQRTKALIEIAHPDFRDELREQARRMHITF